jgi:hypothetical protein
MHLAASSLCADAAVGVLLLSRQPEGSLLELGATYRATSTSSSIRSSGIRRWPDTAETPNREDDSHEAHTNLAQCLTDHDM